MLKTEKQFQVKRERAMKFQREQLEREAAARRGKALNKQKVQEEKYQLERERARAREAAEKLARESQERAARAREAAEKLARESQERARQEAAEEARVKEEQETWAKWWERYDEPAKERTAFTGADAKAARKATKQKAGNKPSGRTSKKPESRKQRNDSCKHPGFWPKVHRQNKCEFCSQTFYAFILKCPECQCMACASCKRDLKIKSR